MTSSLPYGDSPFHPRPGMLASSRTAKPKPRREHLYKQITRRTSEREANRSRLV